MPAVSKHAIIHNRNFQSIGSIPPEYTTTTLSTTSTTTTTTTTTTTSATKTVWGDADCSGSFEMKDLVLLSKALSGKSTLTVSGRTRCDLYADGSINDNDLNIALKLMAGWYSNDDLPISNSSLTV